MTVPRPLILVGAGGLAREVLAAVRSGAGGYEPFAVLDDDPARHGTAVDGVPVRGPVECVHAYPDAAVVLCVASVRRRGARAALAGRLGLPEQRWGTVVHPAAAIAPGTSVGPGTVLLAGVVVTAPQRIGAHVLAMPQVLLTHDDEVGDGATLAGRATLAGGVRVGPDAYVGQGAMVREYVRIGAGAVIGMGAVVLTDVPDGETWVGMPARRLGAVAETPAGGRSEEDR